MVPQIRAGLVRFAGVAALGLVVMFEGAKRWF